MLHLDTDCFLWVTPKLLICWWLGRAEHAHFFECTFMLPCHRNNIRCYARFDASIYGRLWLNTDFSQTRQMGLQPADMHDLAEDNV